MAEGNDSWTIPRKSWPRSYYVMYPIFKLKTLRKTKDLQDFRLVELRPFYSYFRNVDKSKNINTTVRKICYFNKYQIFLSDYSIVNTNDFNNEKENLTKSETFRKILHVWPLFHSSMLTKSAIKLTKEGDATYNSSSAKKIPQKSITSSSIDEIRQAQHNKWLNAKENAQSSSLAHASSSTDIDLSSVSDNAKPNTPLTSSKNNEDMSIDGVFVEEKLLAILFLTPMVSLIRKYSFIDYGKNRKLFLKSIFPVIYIRQSLRGNSKIKKVAIIWILKHKPYISLFFWYNKICRNNDTDNRKIRFVFLLYYLWKDALIETTSIFWISNKKITLFRLEKVYSKQKLISSLKTFYPFYYSLNKSDCHTRSVFWIPFYSKFAVFCHIKYYNSLSSNTSRAQSPKDKIEIKDNDNTVDESKRTLAATITYLFPIFLFSRKMEFKDYSLIVLWCPLRSLNLGFKIKFISIFKSKYACNATDPHCPYTEKTTYLYPLFYKRAESKNQLSIFNILWLIDFPNIAFVFLEKHLDSKRNHVSKYIIYSIYYKTVNKYENITALFYICPKAPLILHQHGKIKAEKVFYFYPLYYKFTSKNVIRLSSFWIPTKCKYALFYKTNVMVFEKTKAVSSNNASSSNDLELILVDNKNSKKHEEITQAYVEITYLLFILYSYNKHGSHSFVSLFWIFRRFALMGRILFHKDNFKVIYSWPWFFYSIKPSTTKFAILYTPYKQKISCLYSEKRFLSSPSSRENQSPSSASMISRIRYSFPFFYNASNIQKNTSETSILYLFWPTLALFNTRVRSEYSKTYLFPIFYKKIYLNGEKTQKAVLWVFNPRIALIYEDFILNKSSKEHTQRRFTTFYYSEKRYKANQKRKPYLSIKALFYLKFYPRISVFYSEVLNSETHKSKLEYLFIIYFYIFNQYYQPSQKTTENSSISASTNTELDTSYEHALPISKSKRLSFLWLLTYKFGILNFNKKQTKWQKEMQKYVQIYSSNGIAFIFYRSTRKKSKFRGSKITKILYLFRNSSIISFFFLFSSWDTKIQRKRKILNFFPIFYLSQVKLTNMAKSVWSFL